jgi:hypothetical protein
MKPYNNDVAVLLIFFTRHEPFEKVFEQVKLARPSKLFLYQDGPRVGRDDDVDNIMKCRAIAEDIDWDCEIHKFYQEKNVGCDPSEYIAQKWMFENVDRGIILEDDDLPTQSFFRYCKELLDKYYHDTRIAYISGTNLLGVYDNGTEDDYFFSSAGSIWGWASWRRTIDLWDEKLSFLEHQPTLKLLEEVMGKKNFNFKLPTWNWHKNSKKQYYESILGSSVWLNSQLIIVPRKNMISNIGVVPDSTHAAASLNKLPKKTRRVFFSETFDIGEVIKHPRYVIKDNSFYKKVYKLLGSTKKRYYKNKIKQILGIK